MVQKYNKWCRKYLEEKDANHVDVIEHVFANEFFYFFDFERNQY